MTRPLFGCSSERVREASSLECGRRIKARSRPGSRRSSRRSDFSASRISDEVRTPLEAPSAASRAPATQAAPEADRAPAASWKSAGGEGTGTLLLFKGDLAMSGPAAEARPGETLLRGYMASTSSLSDLALIAS